MLILSVRKVTFFGTLIYEPGAVRLNYSERAPVSASATPAKNSVGFAMLHAVRLTGDRRVRQDGVLCTLILSDSLAN